MCSWQIRSSSSVETPGLTYWPIISSTSAASAPAMRILAMSSGVLIVTGMGSSDSGPGTGQGTAMITGRARAAAPTQMAPVVARGKAVAARLVETVGEDDLGKPANLPGLAAVTAVVGAEVNGRIGTPEEDRGRGRGAGIDFRQRSACAAVGRGQAELV